MQSPAYDQTAYRGRNDDGGESSATWIASTNTSWTQYYKDPFRIRFAVAEVNGAKDNNRTFQIQYNKNSTGWTNITTSSSNVQAVTSSNYADGDPTTQQISSGAFAGGRMSEDGIAGDNTSTDFAGGDTAEHEYALNFVNADVADGDVFDFRLIFGDGTSFSTYTNTANVTVSTSTNVTISAAAASTTATAVNPGVANTTTISGTCTLNGSTVQGARIIVLDTSNNSVVADTTSDSSGNWSATVDANNTYHALAQYDSDGDGTVEYNSYSKPFLVN